MATGGNALSVRQPYAHLILSGLKTYEARTWMPSELGSFYLHASQSLATGWKQNDVLLDALDELGLSPDDVPDLPRSAIIGEVTVDKVILPDQDSAHDRLSKRHRGLCGGGLTNGLYLWHIVDQVPIKKPITCGGKLFLWPVPKRLLSKL